MRCNYNGIYVFTHHQLAFILSDLTIERFCMTGGKSPIGYLKAYMTNLYLSKDSEKVTEAIEEGESVSVTTVVFTSLVTGLLA